MEGRAGRIGYWVSGIAHLALILWALLAGVLLRPQPPALVQTARVSTMSGAEFEAHAAASRGAGPVPAPQAGNAADLPPPAAGADDDPSSPAPAAPPRPEAGAQALAAPGQPEARPDLDDIARQAPAPVTIAIPDAQPAPPAAPEPLPPVPAAAPPAVSRMPAPPRMQAAPRDEAASPAAPDPALTLEQSRPPRPRAEALAIREAEMARQAEAERLAAEQARQQAQQQAREEEERAEAARRAAEAEQAERQRAAAEQAAAERAATEQAEAERIEAEQETARQTALRDALREALQDPAGSAAPPDTGPADTGPADTENVGNRQRIEGGSNASVEQDPLAAALADALSRARQPEDGAEAPAPAPLLLPGAGAGQMQLAPQTPPARARHPGQPLTLSERDAFRQAIASCWNRGALSLEAAGMQVVLGFELDPQARPIPGSLRLIAAQGGSEQGAQNAFDVARRAILICGGGGFTALPREKYGQWREVIATFGPGGIELPNSP